MTDNQLTVFLLIGAIMFVGHRLVKREHPEVESDPNLKVATRMIFVVIGVLLVVAIFVALQAANLVITGGIK